MNFHIVIPSRSRPRVQKTISNLSQNFWKNLILVTPEHQYGDYRTVISSKINIIPFKGPIGPKRQFILTSQLSGKVIMLDDDLTFYRRTEDSSKFIRMTIDDSEQMINDILTYLDKYVMVSMVDKFMSNTRPPGHVECVRCNKVLAINRDMLPRPWPEFRMPHDEDHDFHLQLITRGFKTAILTDYCKSDPVQAPGGCTDWRSPTVFYETHKLLLSYWPDIVSVHNGRVTYHWKKAMKIGGLL